MWSCRGSSIRVVHFLANLHPFALEFSQGHVVHDRSLVCIPSINGVNDLNPLVQAGTGGSGGDRNRRGPVVRAVLCLQLMDMKKIGGGLQPDGKLELPFQNMPLVPIALSSFPRRIVVSLHLVGFGPGPRPHSRLIRAGAEMCQQQVLAVQVDTVDLSAVTAGEFGCSV